MQRRERHADVQREPRHENVRHAEPSQLGQEHRLVQLLIVIECGIRVDARVDTLAHHDVRVPEFEIAMALRSPRVLHAVARPERLSHRIDAVGRLQCDGREDAGALRVRLIPS